MKNTKRLQALWCFAPLIGVMIAGYVHIVFIFREHYIFFIAPLIGFAIGTVLLQEHSWEKKYEDDDLVFE